MNYNWVQRPIEELGDYIGRAIRLICEEGAYTGEFMTITQEHILMEVAEGTVVAIDRLVLMHEHTQLYIIEEE